MQVFEILVIVLGIVNGALLASLPDPTAKTKPIGNILWFSLTMALFVGFLPVITLGERFLSTTIIAFVGAVCGYFALKSARTQFQDGGQIQTTVPAKHHA